jgi:hypothetical protein
LSFSSQRGHEEHHLHQFNITHSAYAALPCAPSFCDQGAFLRNKNGDSLNCGIVYSEKCVEFWTPRPCKLFYAPLLSGVYSEVVQGAAFTTVKIDSLEVSTIVPCLLLSRF